MSVKALTKYILLCLITVIVPFWAINHSIALSILVNRLLYKVPCPRTVVIAFVISITLLFVVLAYKYLGNRISIIAIIVLCAFILNVLSDFRLSAFINSDGVEFLFIVCSLWDIGKRQTGAPLKQLAK